MLKEEGLLKCPECGAAVQRISGCQYMICSSSQCQGRTYFCYECGIKLEEDHGAHICNPRILPKAIPHPDDLEDVHNPPFLDEGYDIRRNNIHVRNARPQRRGFIKWLLRGRRNN